MHILVIVDFLKAILFPVIKDFKMNITFPYTEEAYTLEVNGFIGNSRCGAAKTNLTSIHEDVGLIPASLSGLVIWHCQEVWCMTQIRLRSHISVAVALAGSYSSSWILSLGTSKCCRCGPEKQKIKIKI